MVKIYLEPETEGFHGVYYKNPKGTNSTFIAMLGDDCDDMMAHGGVKYLLTFGCNVLCMSPAKKDYGTHNYPVERFGCAIDFLKKNGNTKIAIVGASTTGMLALVAASFYKDITLTVVVSPCDFVMEGFYQDELDGVGERPGDNESSVSVQGKPLPYLPYVYRHPDYWYEIKKEAKAGKDILASRKMFDESEKRHPIQEDEYIKVENIQGHIEFIGAEDDVLWDTCRYIRRMDERLKTHSHSCTYNMNIYEKGTHFLFPQGMLKTILPIGSGLLIRFLSLVVCFQRNVSNPERMLKEKLPMQ